VYAADFTFFSGPVPVAMAHRGGAAYPPNLGVENTLAAFGRAVAMGYRHLETDVHATRDGRVIAFHDATLDRVTDASGAISAVPWEVVRRARVGGREPVPLLGEVLSTFPDARITIDVKADDAVAPTIREVLRAGAAHRVCLGSFSPARLRALRRALGPRVATAAGQLGTALLRFTPDLVTRLLHTPAPVLQIPVSHRWRGHVLTVVTPGLVRRAHRLGKQVHVWFPRGATEDAAEMNRLLDLGVDGLVVDRIDVLADVLAQRGRPLRPATGATPPPAGGDAR
jgi:glycerophosphoryl diester phosphodiesterase